MYGEKELEKAKQKVGHLAPANLSAQLAGDLLDRTKEAAENLQCAL